jgi:hypothetical protein
MLLNENSFDDLIWINHHLNLNIKLENINSILMFTLYWNILEHELCNDNFKIDKIRKYIKEYNIDKQNFTRYYEYFRDRYYTGNGNTNYYFDGLKLSKQNIKYVQDCFINQNPTNEELISSLFLIIQRLRNNIFHGLKEPRNFEEQELNFKIANKAIATILNIVGNKNHSFYAH